MMTDPVKRETPPPPSPGDTIYVCDSEERGDVWTRGGRAVVARTFAKGAETFIEIEGSGRKSWVWSDIADQQGALQAKYGNIAAGQLMIGTEEWLYLL